MGFITDRYRGVLAHFTTDPRAVSLFRFLLGVYALNDLILRLHPSSGLGIEFYCGKSFLPWAPLEEGDTPHTGPIHKIMFWRGPLWFQLALFAFHFLVLVCFTLTSLIPGPLLRRTLSRAAPARVSSLLLPLLSPTVNGALFWLLTILMHGRTDEFNDASDKLFRNVVIWMGFLPYPALCAPGYITHIAAPPAADTTAAGSAPALRLTYAPAAAPTGSLAGAAVCADGVVEWPLLTVTLLRLLRPLAPLAGPCSRRARRKRLALAHAAADALFSRGAKSAADSDGDGEGDHGDFASYVSAAVVVSPSAAANSPAQPPSQPLSAPAPAPTQMLVQSPSLTGAALVGLLGQVCWLYIALTVDRWYNGYSSWLDLSRGDAVHHVLGGSLAVRPLGAFLARLPNLTWLATVLTNPAELFAGATLLLLPATPLLERRIRDAAALRATGAPQPSCGAALLTRLARAALAVRALSIFIVLFFQSNLAAALRLPYFQCLSMIVMVPFFSAQTMDAADRALAALYLWLGPADADSVNVSKAVAAAPLADASAPPADANSDGEDDISSDAGPEATLLRRRKPAAAPAAPASAVVAVPPSAPSVRAPRRHNGCYASGPCTSLRACVPWLMIFYSLALIAAYDLRLFARLPDDGDIGEAIRYNQRWLMFSPPPDSYFYWQITAHYTLADADATVSTAVASADAPAVDPAHTVPLEATSAAADFVPPLPFDVFAALRSGRWAHPADATVEHALLGPTRVSRRRAAADAAAEISAGRTAILAARLAELAAAHPRNSTFVPALLRAPAPTAPALPRVVELATIGRPGSVPPSRERRMARDRDAVEARFAAAAARAAAATRALALAASAAPVTPPVPAGGDGDDIDVYPFTRALATPLAGETGAGVREGDSASDGDGDGDGDGFGLWAAFEAESQLTSGGDARSGPHVIQHTSQYWSWRLERFYWLTHSAFGSEFKRDRRVRSLGGYYCAHWGRWLRRAGVALPPAAQRHVRFRTNGYRIQPPAYPRPNAPPLWSALRTRGLAGVLDWAADTVRRWFVEQEPIKRTHERVTHDVVYTC